MDGIILENFRCFRSYQEVPLAPLTLLVGENSTGKTSFLAAIRLAWDLTFGPRFASLDFNEEPFDLGAYRQIAAHPATSKGETAKHFKLGSVIHNSRGGDHESRGVKIIGKFVNRDGQPELCESIISSGEFIISFIIKEGANGKKLSEVKIKTPPESYQINDWRHFPSSGPIRDQLVLLSYESSLWNGADMMEAEKEFNGIIDLLEERFADVELKPYAVAPIRTQPRRTYNPTTFEPKSTGDHIPMALAKIQALADNNEWSGLQKALSNFGIASGLFKEISIKQLGRPLVDPFQIQIKVSNTYDNLIDVGYGVSQVLPILIEGMMSPGQQSFLLQQPEVHLHPRAQAELGTLLGTIVKKKNMRFVVETHSDYIIDRLRLDLKAKKPGFPEPRDVLILYFERDKKEVKIHPIRIDNNGNLEGAPPTYRSFFLEEERRFWE